MRESVEHLANMIRVKTGSGPREGEKTADAYEYLLRNGIVQASRQKKNRKALLDALTDEELEDRESVEDVMKGMDFPDFEKKKGGEE